MRLVSACRTRFLSAREENHEYFVISRRAMLLAGPSNDAPHVNHRGIFKAASIPRDVLFKALSILDG